MYIYIYISYQKKMHQLLDYCWLCLGSAKKIGGTTPLWRVMPGNCFYAKMTALFTRAITIYPEVAKKMETVNDNNQERWGYWYILPWFRSRNDHSGGNTHE